MSVHPIHRMFWPIAAAIALLSGVPVSRAWSQANYSESFQGVGDGESGIGGPSTLSSRGWIFRNQSRGGPGISPYWTEFAGWGQSGSGLGHGGFAVWQNNQSKISAWALLPAIPDQVAGDPLSIWTSGSQNSFGENPATLEIRYSPTGGTSTGTGENAVGDFTQVLATASGPHAWTQRLVTLPGNGRIALRLVMGPGSSSQVFGGTMLIDSLQVGNPPPPPHPMPAAGQTVHWTMAHSPVQIARNGAGQSPILVAGGTVIVDPGVEVRFASGAQLEVRGTIELAGTAAQPVRLRGPGSPVVQNGGLLSGLHVDVQSFTDVTAGGKVVYVDSAFTDPSVPTGFSYDSAGDIGQRFFGGDLSTQRQIVSLTRCTFGQGCSIALQRGWLAARDCSFFRGGQVHVGNDPVGGEAMMVWGSAILENVTVQEAYIDVFMDKKQRRFIGDVSVTGNARGPGIRLQGGASYLIEDSVTLQGNKWPVNIGRNSAGILPGSVLPATGNEFNEVPDTDDAAPMDEDVVWANAGIPYAVTENNTTHGRITILPGVTVKIAQDVSFFFDTDSHGVAGPIFLGEPEQPILFTSYEPGTQWYSLAVGNVKWFGARWDWCIFEHSRFGVGFHGMPLSIDNSIFRNNHRAVWTGSYFSPRKCTFENNVYSITGEDFAPNHTIGGFLNANHPANPNSFINNNGTPDPDYFFNTFLPDGGLIARATHNSLENTDSDVRNNWWGTPTGPSEHRNPGGQGDAVFFGLHAGGYLLPFLTEPPTSNPPPVVRFVTPHQEAVPGEKYVVQWTARDDGSITAQRVYYSPDSNTDHQMQLLAEIPASARSYEFTVPSIGTPPNGADQFLRVVAVDDLGQEGIADLPMKITNPAPFTGTLTPDPAVAGEHRPGELLPACAAYSGVVGSVYVALEFDNDETSQSLGGAFVENGLMCNILGAAMPDISTDRARFRFDATGTLNQVKSFYSPWFSIRPDPLLGDAAPQVSLTSNHTGQSYAGGAVVNIAWTASDDEALRSFDIRASYDGGTRWMIVARDLPADARSYAWRLHDSQGIPQVKLRVVAKDRRFQNSSAESGEFEITQGGFTGCVVDLNDSGSADVPDIFSFLSMWFASDAAADFDGNGTIAVPDIFAFLGAWFVGC